MVLLYFPFFYGPASYTLKIKVGEVQAKAYTVYRYIHFDIVLDRPKGGIKVIILMEVLRPKQNHAFV